jgi:hypothetical protein
MRRVRWLLVLALLLVPTVSRAIQFHWSTGADTLTFAEATRAILVLRADSAEVTLPPEWRLLWVGDSTEVEVVELDSLEVCEGDTAQVYGADGPTTPADSAANLTTAYFCSGGSQPEQAAYRLDLPAWGRGKCKVVALDPADSTSVLESNEVTFNGGVSDPYPSVVLAATSVHQSLLLEVAAVGAGLEAISSLSLVAPDSSWALPLTVTAKSSGSVRAIASVAALLPACKVSVEAEGGATSSVSLPADETPEVLEPEGCTAQFFEELLWPPPPLHGYTIQPKDFAFARGFVDVPSSQFALHFFYIRHNYWYHPPLPAPQHPELDEKNIGHIWTTDFESWYGPDGLNKPDTVALAVRPGKFDEFHVWAPTIVQHGPDFWMFYTGVRNEGGKQHQRIGRATSTDLVTWTPADDPVLTAPEIPWAKKDPAGPPYNGAQQLRDPFVMRDPVNPGQWLMYFVAEDSIWAPKMAVGVARSTNLLDWQPLPDPFRSTERPTFQGTTTLVESPHIFSRHGQWWMAFPVDNPNQVFFETSTSTDPAATDSAHWSHPVWLRGVTQGEPPELAYWHATEHLRITPAAEYMAAWNDNASSIDIKGVFEPADPALDSLRFGCPQIADVPEGKDSRDGVRLTVSRAQFGVADVDLRLELPSPMSVRVAVYDVAGRRRVVLLDGRLPGGTTVTTWNGRDQAGIRVASGVYFVRLTSDVGTRLSKLVMLR